MADTWEDEAPVQAPAVRAKGSTLNPSATSFSFNPGATSFMPPSAHSVQQNVDFQRTYANPGATPPNIMDAATSNTEPAAGTSVPDVDMDMPTTVNGSGAAHLDTTEDEETPKPSRASTPDRSAQQRRPPPVGEQPPHPGEARGGTEPGFEDDEEEEEDSDAKARREAELKQIYEELSKEDAREHMNVVFIGHVDAGKSTTGGQILYLTGGVDERTIQKYEKEAKEKNRESWYMAYIMDTNEEERAKGKTVEVGRAHFTTEKKRYTILDAPGHKNYVPNMIAGAAQADVGVLVIAARKGEFETGFERGGQTREHAQLAKTLGVAKLIVAVNKMDDPSVAHEDGSWDKARYDEIVEKLTPFLRSCGYNPKKDIIFLPVSGLLGHNIKDPVSKELAPWWRGGSLFSVLDDVEPLPRDPLGPFRMSVIDKYKDMGTIAMGKSEAGIVRKGDRLYVMPNKTPVMVTNIYRDDTEVNAAKGGENLRLRLTGVDEDEMQAGFVICSRHVPVPCVTYFDAQLQILDLLEHKAVFTAGYKAVLHIHSLVEECEIIRLLAAMDMKTRPPTRRKAKFVKSNSVVIVRIAVEKQICVEPFDRVPQLGRFTLRDEGRTIAIGKVIKVPRSLKEAE